MAAPHSNTLAIVIPVLNEAPAIGPLLVELATWRAAGDTIIVVDGGSDDATVAIAEQCGAQVLKSARGRARQMNAGAAASAAGVMWFLHADSKVSANLREAILAACAAGARWGRCDVRIDDAAPVFRLIEALMNARSRLTGMATGDQGLFVTRELFDAVGGFAPLPLMEDIDLSRRLAHLARPHCLRARLTTSARRWRTRGIVRTILLMWALRLAWWCGVPARRLAHWYR